MIEADDPLKGWIGLGREARDAAPAGADIKLRTIDAQATRPPPAPPVVDLQLQLLENHAYALAELCKRIGWQDVRGLAVADAEARNMIVAMDRIRSALELAGVRVR